MKKDLKAIQEHCEFDDTPNFVKHLSGGDINEVFLINDGNQSWVVKKNNKDRYPKMLEKELNALDLLVEHVPNTYPRALKAFSDDYHQYLILEYFEQGDNSNQGQINLGCRLAKQHNVSSDMYGFDEDNFIGSLPQTNTKQHSWSDFYANNRLLAQARLAYDTGVVGKSFVAQMERFCNKIDEIFPEEKPALLHGDLWGGNYFIRNNHAPLLYDPAIYFGHREIDIAMTRLFGGFSSKFYDAYNETSPLEKGWENRIPYGQLYPNMVHLNLFGRAYLGAVSSVIERF